MDSFREGVRTRDGKCVVTGIVNALSLSRWDAFEAAHIPAGRGFFCLITSLRILEPPGRGGSQAYQQAKKKKQH